MILDWAFPISSCLLLSKELCKKKTTKRLLEGQFYCLLQGEGGSDYFQDYRRRDEWYFVRMIQSLLCSVGRAKKKKYNTNICKILKPFTRDIYVKFHITSFIGQ